MRLAETRHKETQWFALYHITAVLGADLLPLSLAFYLYCLKKKEEEKKGKGLEREAGCGIKRKKD